MDAVTLTKISGYISLTRAHSLIPGLYEAFALADLDNFARRRMFLAQTAEETGGWTTTTEYASGDEYEGRADLGNIYPGDGVRFKGRGFIQLTGRSNYSSFGVWCHHRGLVSSDRYFLDHPAMVATYKFAWISAAYYWKGNHNHGYMSLNAASDAHDVRAATLMINGGLNGFDTRLWYYNRIGNLGSREIMSWVGEHDQNWSDVATKPMIQQMIDDSLHNLMLGDDAEHRRHPLIYGNVTNGISDRFAKLQTEINALKRKVGL